MAEVPTFTVYRVYCTAMTLEAGLLLLLLAVVGVAFYCVQRILLDILRTLRLMNVKMLNVAQFLKPEEKLDENPEDTSLKSGTELLPKVN